ncbi:MAG: hypothetical protein LBG42_05045 [Treponema sp.]|jgi:hypothetical protein|nr:hypothetical protein [Treponema sp.]
MCAARPAGGFGTFAARAVLVDNPQHPGAKPDNEVERPALWHNDGYAGVVGDVHAHVVFVFVGKVRVEAKVDVDEFP